MNNASKPTITKVTEKGHTTNFKDAETTEWNKEFTLAWFLSARALAAFAWANTFGLAWALLLDVIPWDKFSAPMFILFFLIAVGAAGVASKKEGSRIEYL